MLYSKGLERNQNGILKHVQVIYRKQNKENRERKNRESEQKTKDKNSISKPNVLIITAWSKYTSYKKLTE